MHYAQYLAELPDMSGKTVVVTGASRGLGFVTALSLAAEEGDELIVQLLRNPRHAACLEALFSPKTHKLHLRPLDSHRPRHPPQPRAFY